MAYFNGTGYDAFDAGIYTVGLKSLSFMAASSAHAYPVRNATSGLQTQTTWSATTTVMFSFPSFEYAEYTEENIVRFSWKGYSPYYLSNSTATYSGDDATFVLVPYFTSANRLYFNYYNTSGTINTFLPLSVVPEYLLNLDLRLNSTHYYLSNVKVFTYSAIPLDNSPPTSWLTDQFIDVKEYAWIEQDPFNIVLRSPYYKLKIYDADGNQLFLDESYQNFTVSRTVDLESVKVQNNAAEPIVVSIADPTDLTYASTSLYQANQSITIPLGDASEIDFSEMGTDFTVYDNELETLLTGNSTHLTYGSTLGGSTVAMENLTLIRHNDLTYAPDFDTYFDHAVENLTVVRNGHYQGFDSFDAALVNSQGSYYSKSNFNGYIANELDGHRKVLNLTRNSATATSNFIFNFAAAPTSGSYEFWVYCPSTNYIPVFSFGLKQTILRIANYGGGHVVYASGGAWTTYNLGALTYIDQWVHFRLTYNTSYYQVYKNGVSLGIIPNLVSADYSRLALYTDPTTNEKWSAFDAVDCSWADGYTTNRNTYLNTSEDLWDLDAYADWENDGHYQGAESFDLETVNVQPSRWITAGNMHVEDEIDGHRKVLAVNMSSGAAAGGSFSFAAVANIQCEFYFRKASNNPMYFYIKDAAGKSLMAMFLVYTGATMTVYNGTDPKYLGSLSVNTWYHVRINVNNALETFDVFLDGTQIADEHKFYTAGAGSAVKFGCSAYILNGAWYFDAFDYSGASGYFLNRNTLLNTSQDLWDWEAYPEWDSGYLQSPLSKNSYTKITVSDVTEVDDEIYGIKNLKFFTTGANPQGSIYYTINSGTAGNSIETWVYVNNTSTVFSLSFGNSTHSPIRTWWWGGGSPVNYYTRQDSTNQTSILTNPAGSPILYHCRVVLTNSTHYTIYINGTNEGTFVYYGSAKLGGVWNRALISFHGTFTANNKFGFGVVDYSSASGYFLNRNMLDNTTTSPLAMDYTLPGLDPYANSTLSNLTAATTDITVYPYASTLAQLDYADYAYTVSDLYNNELETGWLLSTESEIVYTPPETRQLFISLADQQNNYLNWENYKIRVNNTLIYSNSFYREIGTSWNISIYTRFDKYITSTLHTVDRDENYIPITLTLYSLKIFNQQTAFLHYNITLDPNVYPGSTIFYSEWLAPSEIGINKIPADYYKITLMHNETGTPQYASYSLTFNNDDILLVSSSNTIFAVLQNINNLGTEIDSQFTYVALNFTNTNSVIGDQTTLIEINFLNTNTTLENMIVSNIYSFEFMNSTLADLLVNQENTFLYTNATLAALLLNQENTFTFLNSSVNDLYSLSQNSFTFINSSTNTLLLQCENSFDFINSTVIDLRALSENSFTFLNSSITSLSAISLNSFSYLNSSIENSITWMAQNFTYTNSQISNNQIALLTQFGIVLSNVTNNSIDIMNNIIAVNSSISNLIADLETNVLLVNNSIYTAVLNVSTALAIDSNNILGNLTITYQQNEFLTDLFKKTMFSELLNWSGVGYNYSLIEDQIEAVSFVNNYRNESIELLLRYQGEIETLQLAALESIDLHLPSDDVSFRIKSINTGEYLTEWEDLSGTEIDLGYYEETIPATPEDIRVEIKDYLLLALFFAIFGLAVTGAYIKTRSDYAASPQRREERADQPGVSDSGGFYFRNSESARDRARKKQDASKSAVSWAIFMAVAAFVVAYLAIMYWL